MEGSVSWGVEKGIRKATVILPTPTCTDDKEEECSTVYMVCVVYEEQMEEVMKICKRGGNLST